MMKIPDEARLTQEEGEAAVNEKLDFIRLNRGHWEDVVPIVADLQLTRLLLSLRLWPEKRRESG